MTISRVGVATGTTSATVPAHNVGDIIVIFAFRGGNTTAPSLPAGYTSILTKSGTSCSARLGYKIATATNDTSGTWTNASVLTCHVYRAGSYATGGSLYIGGSASAAQTVNTVNYPALTMIHGDNTSWALGFAGVNNTTETVDSPAPSGMTNESALTGASQRIAGHDTNGTVSSWSSTNAVTTGTAGNSVSATVELIENQPGAAISNFVQHRSYAPENPAASGEHHDNHDYFIDPTLAGNGLVVVVAYPSGNTPVITDDKSNTWPASGAAGTVTADNGAGNMALQAFVLTSAVTGTSIIRVAFGGVVLQMVKVWVTQLYNVTGTINTSANASGVNAAGIVSPGSITPGTANCLVLSYMVNDSGTGGVGTGPALIVPETGYALNDADISFLDTGLVNASQFQLQTSAVATTPRFYINGGATTDTYSVLTLALTTGSQGTPKPSGPGVAPWIDRMLYFGTNSGAASWLLQIPSSGNAGVFTTPLADTGTPHMTTVTDNDGVTWTNEQPGGAGSAIAPTRVNSSARLSRTASVGLVGAPNNFHMIYYDLSNCAVAPVVATAAHTSITLDNLSTIADAPTITPPQTNCLTIAFMQVGLGPGIIPTSPVGAIWDLAQTAIARFTGSITTTSLTVSATAWGTVGLGSIIYDNGGIGQQGSPTNTSLGTIIVSGASSPFTIQPSQSVASETMWEGGSDGSTITWGNCAGHFFNGASVAAQSWTWSIANQPSNSGSALALIFAGTASAGDTLIGEMPILMM